jgi:hypothetical protein
MKIFMRKYRLLLILSLFGSYLSFAQNVGIGTSTPAASAKLDVTSTTGGLLPPRMTTQQRNAVTSPTPGLMIFNTDLQQLEVFTTFEWQIMINSLPSVEKLFGGALDDYVQSIQQTTGGGYIVAGYSNSSASGNVTGTNHGLNDFWIVKLNGSGNIVWNKLLGGAGDDYALSIQQTTDGGYIIAGYTNSSSSGDVTGNNHSLNDFWIVKLDASGNIVWNKLLGGNSFDDAYAIQQTTDGGYIVAGTTSSSANGNVTGTNNGNNDYWVVKLDGSGNIVWNKLLGGNGYDIAYAIQQTTDGGYIVSGFTSSSASGNVTGTNHGSNDYWVVKLDGSGNIVWNKLLGGIGNDVGNDIQQTTDGGYIVAGYTYSSANGDVTGANHGSNDYWVVKLDGSGNIVWNKLLGGNSSEFAKDIQQLADGGYIIAGYTNSSASGDVTGTNHGNSDYWVVKLDGSGNIVWNRLLGATGIDEAFDIQQTTDGGYIVAGSTNSPANGDVTGANHGNNDYWIVKLDALGLIIR